MAKVLGVGVAALDIINRVDRYPDEDDEVRAVHQELRRGGNVTNTLSVLSQLGRQCSWAGVYTEDRNMPLIRQALDSEGIDMQWCRCEPKGSMPVSSITLSMQNGSRTIIHYRDLPEYDFDDFRKIPLQQFQWIHFEGRNITRLRTMMEFVRSEFPRIPLSLEVEKPREQIETLLPLADLCLFSSGYVQAQGYSEASGFLHQCARELPGVILVCAWGDQGGYGINQAGEYCTAPAVVHPKVVDTLGAGDVFNAAIIHACINNRALPEALSFACKLAGKKCAQLGLRALV